MKSFIIALLLATATSVDASDRRRGANKPNPTAVPKSVPQTVENSNEGSKGSECGCRYSDKYNDRYYAADHTSRRYTPNHYRYQEEPECDCEYQPRYEPKRATRAKKYEPVCSQYECKGTCLDGEVLDQTESNFSKLDSIEEEVESIGCVLDQISCSKNYGCCPNPCKCGGKGCKYCNPWCQWTGCG